MTAESYAVESTLSVRDELSVVLEKIGRLGEVTAKALGAINKSGAGWGSMARQMSDIASAMNRAAASAEKFANASGRMNQTADPSRMDGFAAAAERAARASERAARAASPGTERAARAASPGTERAARAASPGTERAARAASPGTSVAVATIPGTERAARAASPGTSVAVATMGRHIKGRIIDAEWEDVSRNTRPAIGGGGGNGSYPLLSALAARAATAGAKAEAAVRPVGATGAEVAEAAVRPVGGNGGFELLAGGYILRVAGGSILDFVGRAVRDAAGYTHQLALMQIAGMSQNDIAQATQAAWQTSRSIPTTTVTENLAALSETRSIFGTTSEAISFLPYLQQMATVLGAESGKAINRKDLAYTTSRAAEMLGGLVNPQTNQIDPSRLQGYLDLMSRAVIATHGKVDPQQWLNFAQQAGAAAKRLTPEALGMMTPIINEMGGFRAGTALTSMYQQLVGGVMPQRVVADWKNLGLIDMAKVTATRMGVRLAPGAIQGEDVFKTNPVAWVESTLIPAMRKGGFTQDRMTDEIMRLFSRQTSQREASIMATQLVQIHRDYGMQMAAFNAPNAFRTLINADPVMQMAALRAQWANFMTALGNAVIPVVVPALVLLTKALTSLGGFVQAHPTLTKWILGFATALGALMVVVGSGALLVGTIELLSAAFGGLLTAMRFVGVVRGLSAGFALLMRSMSAISFFKSAATPAAGVAAGIGGAASTAILASAAVVVAAAIIPAVYGLMLPTLEKRRIVAKGTVAAMGVYAQNGAPVPDARPDVGSWGKLGDWMGWNKPRSPGAPSATQARTVTSNVSGTGAPSLANQANAENQSAVATIAAAIKQALNGTSVQLDGKKVGQMVTDQQNRQAQRPPVDTGNVDTRATPFYSGMAMGLGN